MAGPVYSSRVVAGGDEGSDSDDWDIGVVRQEPQVGLSLGPASRGWGASAWSREGSGARWGLGEGAAGDSSWAVSCRRNAGVPSIQ